MTVVSALFLIIGIVSFSFILWKKLKDDYPSDLIFRFTLVLLFSGSAGFIFADRWFPDFSLFAGLVTSSLIGAYAVKKFNLKFFEVVDAAVISWFWLLFFIRASSVVAVLRLGRADLIIHAYLFSSEGRQVLAGFCLAIAMILLYSFLRKRYRGFSWYPSGKVGFMGMSTLFVFLPLQGALAFFTSPVVPAILGVIISCLVSGAIGVLIYNRSGKRR